MSNDVEVRKATIKYEFDEAARVKGVSGEVEKANASILPMNPVPMTSDSCTVAEFYVGFLVLSLGPMERPLFLIRFNPNTGEMQFEIES